ncbi:competence type IV pilus minor pilin ComGD [Ureibacillus sp. NPDC094379]
MDYKLKSNAGFTLIEMLLVLFILGMISSVIFQLSFKYTEKQETELFFNQLLLDLQSIQSLAIETRKTTYVSFEENHYRVYHQPTDPFIKRNFPDDITFNKYSNLKLITFTSVGEILRFGKLIFYTPFGTKELMIYIEKGRMKFVE